MSEPPPALQHCKCGHPDNEHMVLTGPCGGCQCKQFELLASNLRPLLMRARGEIRMSQCTVCGRNGYSPNPDCSNCVDRVALENDLLSFPVETTTDGGYRSAFYQIAELLGLSAMSISPKEAFETVMLPRLRELVAFWREAE